MTETERKLAPEILEAAAGSKATRWGSDAIEYQIYSGLPEKGWKQKVIRVFGVRIPVSADVEITDDLIAGFNEAKEGLVKSYVALVNALSEGLSKKYPFSIEVKLSTNQRPVLVRVLIQSVELKAPTEQIKFWHTVSDVVPEPTLEGCAEITDQMIADIQAELQRRAKDLNMSPEIDLKRRNMKLVENYKRAHGKPAIITTDLASLLEPSMATRSAI